jgi:simple sugar transport system ATP-binding protein
MDFIAIENCSKAFGGVKALKGISFSVKKGEVHGLVGENGSGKSTLINILAGSLSADSGKITIDGVPMASYGALSGMQYGISVIYQDFSLFPNLTVLENVCISNQIKDKKAFFSIKKHAEEVNSILDQLDAHISLSDIVGEMPVAKQQMVAIARALNNKPKLLIFDEPTTALTREEINNLFKIIGMLKEKGISIIFISHKIDEIMEICDVVTILRDGIVIDVKQICDVSVAEIEKLMVGASSVYTKHVDDSRINSDACMLKVKGLSKANNFLDISFDVKKGEIIGFTGLLGSGRTEIATALFGIAPADSGEIEIDGQRVSIHNVEDAVSHGLAYVPENRLTQGLVMDYSQRDNIILSTISKFAKKGLLDESRMTETANFWIDEVKVKTDDVHKQVKTLSGGNQQKIVLAKWLEMKPKVLILDGPTVGVDVGAKASIFKTIHEMVEKYGMSVILISDEIRELTANCNRILVMQNGRLRRVLDKPQEIDDDYIKHILDEQKRAM